MSAQHRAVLSVPATKLPESERPTPGPIALLPESEPPERFEAAVREAGGSAEPLSERTRAIAWLANSGADQLVQVLEENPQVQWVQLPWAGVDAFAEVLAEHSRPDLLWTSAKGAYAQPVAEHALALTLATLRQLPMRARTQSWGDKVGTSLFGLSVLIVGAGGIAVELLRLLALFECRVTVVRRSTGKVEGADRTVTSDRLDEVLPNADVVVVAAASTNETRHLLGAAQLALLKPTAVLVNVARGTLVDTEALDAALASGALAGAGLDVTDPEPLPDGHPLWTRETCIITSHSADTPEMTAPLLAERLRVNVEGFLGDGSFEGIVDPTAGY